MLASAVLPQGEIVTKLFTDCISEVIVGGRISASDCARIMRDLVAAVTSEG